MTTTGVIHVLKCWRSQWRDMQLGVVRATCRRCDDRPSIAIGDRLRFVLAEPPVQTEGATWERMAEQPGVIVEPRQDLDAVVTRVDGMMGPHVIFGVHPSASTVPFEPKHDLVPVTGIPFVLIHFRLLEDTPRVVEDEEDYRKILSCAGSAGDTISEREALELIKSIARGHLSSIRGRS
jgi:hypothetical protein